jgi:gas vesicle protein
MKSENNIKKARGDDSFGFADKLLLFVLGGAVGAAVALLFAPKPGEELRKNIADQATKRYEETLEVANRLKERTGEYYQTTREKSEEVMNVVASGASEIKHDVIEAARTISGIVGKSA